MEINIVSEIYKLRAEFLKATSQSPLPTTVKLMIANELVAALSGAEVNEIKRTSLKKQETKVKETESKEG